MPILLAVALGLAVLVFFFGMSRMPPEVDTSVMVEQRLQTYQGLQPVTLRDIELQEPFSERFLRPALNRLGGLLSRSTPEKARQSLADRLELAGRPGNLTPEDFGAVRLVVAAVAGVVGLLVGALIGGLVPLVVALLAGVVLGYFFPSLWLRQRVDARRSHIQKALPDALDLMVIAVDAGLGFDAALTRVTEKYQNALSTEFFRMLHEVSLGRPRLQALEDLGRRTGVEDLHNFVQAVIQSEEFGTGIARILRIQADEMRRKRKQRAQELAAQATLKMMLPMVGCIFPTLWIVLLGPAVLILMGSH